MSTSMPALPIILGCGLIAAAAYLSLRDSSSSANRGSEASTPEAKVAASPAFASTWATIAEADKIEDPVQRCLKYPDPPGMQWDADVVRAVCLRAGYTYLSIDDIAKALDEGHADTIERTYQDYLDQGTSNPDKRGLLAVAFRTTFEATGEKIQAVVDRWVATAPKSAFALAARGLHAITRASEARGGESVGRTEQRRFVRMNVILEDARKDLRAALEINPRLTIAYRGLFIAAKMHGTREEIAGYADAALQVDPADDRVYLDWISASEPRWGGSELAMAAIARKANEHRNVNPFLRLVAEKLPGDAARALWVDRRYPEALAKYEEALRIAPSPTDFAMAGDVAMATSEPGKALWYYSQAYRFTGSVTDHFSRANALLALHEDDIAKGILDQVTAKGSDAPGAMAEIGDALWRMRRYQDAENAFLAELRKYPKDARTLKSLTHLYVTDLHAVDKAQPYIVTLITEYPADARGWLYKAAGNKPKDEMLDAMKRYLQLVDRDDPYEQPTIKSVEAKIRTLEQQP